MRRGQMFASDLAISIALFMILVSIGVLTLNEAVQNQTRFNQQHTMAQKASQTADLLVRTQGYPRDWNRSTMRVPGLAEPTHFIQSSKFIELKRTNRSYFARQARVTGHNFTLEVLINDSLTSIGGIAPGRTALLIGEDRQWIQTLDRSGTTYDLYWAGGAVPPNDASTVHTGSFTSLFDTVLANASNYSLMMAIDTAVNESDLADPGRLDEFVSGGGVYLQEGQGRIIDALGLSPDTSPGNSGDVFRRKQVLREGLERRDSIVFSEPAYGFSTPDTRFINTSTVCFACAWEHGNGRVYYLTDDNVSQTTQTLLGLDGGHIHSAFIAGANSSYGRWYTEDAGNILPRSRRVLLNNSGNIEQAVVRFSIW